MVHILAITESRKFANLLKKAYNFRGALKGEHHEISHPLYHG